MKQFTILKVLVFSALSIVIFPVFTMDKQRRKSLKLLVRKKAEKTTLLIKKGKSNQYMKYDAIKKLSKSEMSGNHTVEIIAYLLVAFCVWECPNPCDNHYRIEQARCNSIQMEKLYITFEVFNNYANWES